MEFLQAWFGVCLFLMAVSWWADYFPTRYSF